MKTDHRFIVEMRKVTLPDGERKTSCVIAYDLKGKIYHPNSEMINYILPKIDEQYERMLLEYFSNGKKNLEKYLNEFLVSISSYAIIGKGLRDVLVEDLNVSINTVEDMIKSTEWYKEVIKYVKREYKKINKEDPVRYAENIRQLAELFGVNGTLEILNEESIGIRRSTVQALCKIAVETPKIKQLIRSGKLKLTIAFEIPSFNEEEREKIAQKLSNTKYSKAKQYLKKLKRQN